MKKNGLVFGMVFFFSSILWAETSSRPTVQRLEWFQGTFQEALQKAKQEKKLVFLDMYASWCFPCKKYDKIVFPNPKVVSFLSKYFILVRRDGNIGEGRILRMRYNVTTYPNLLVIHPDMGLEIDRLIKYMDTPLFLVEMEKIRNGQRALKGLLAQLKQNPKSIALHYQIGLRYAYRGDADCEKYLKFVSDHATGKDAHLGQLALYTLGRIYHRNTRRDCPSALKVFDEYLQKYPNGSKKSQVESLHRKCSRQR